MTQSIDADPSPNLVSKRALRALTPALSYGKAFGIASQRVWTPEDPEGNILCSIAENKLTTDLLHAKILEVQREVPLSTLSYPKQFKGPIEAREAFAHVLKKTFMKGVPVDPEHLVLLSGAGAILDLLFWCLTESGEGVLLPTPIYPAFINDMEVRSGAHPVLFPFDEERDVHEQLTLQAEAAAAQGHPVKMFLLTNPNNPMGTIYSRKTVSSMLHWCLKNKVHFVSDEIYALSTWGDDDNEFISTEVLARQEVAEGQITHTQAELVPQLLHTVCGLSKDFCASGLRVGVLYSRNTSLIEAYENLSYFHTVCNPMIWTMTQILNDDAFIDMFLAENKKRMRSAYKGLSDALTAAGIPHVHAKAAMFCWVDLRQGLREASWEGERELLLDLMSAGVFITPGEACKAHDPGFFRICWAWVPADALPVAAQRIAKVLKLRKQGKE